MINIPITQERKERVAIAIGGSIFAPMQLNPKFLAILAQGLIELSEEKDIFVVVGGGSTARQYIETAREISLDKDEKEFDEIGIQATRLNAKLLSYILRNTGAPANRKIPHTTDDALILARRYPIIVMGGTDPGHSTDQVAAELAVKGNCARLVIATNVKGVFNKDPRNHPDAQMISELNFVELIETIGTPEWTSAGMASVIDGLATRLITVNAIPTNVVHGEDLENLVHAARGESFLGTRISAQKKLKA